MWILYEIFLIFIPVIFLRKFWDCWYLSVFFRGLGSLSPLARATGFLDLTTPVTLLTPCWLGMANAGAWAHALTAGTDACVGLILHSHHTLSIIELLGSSLYSFFLSLLASLYQTPSLSLFLSHIGFGTDNWNGFHLNLSMQTYKFLLSINVHIILLRWCPLLGTLLPKAMRSHVCSNYYSHLNWLMWHKNKLSCQTTGRLK